MRGILERLLELNLGVHRREPNPHLLWAAAESAIAPPIDNRMAPSGNESSKSAGWSWRFPGCHVELRTLRNVDLHHRDEQPPHLGQRFDGSIITYH